MLYGTQTRTMKGYGIGKPPMTVNKMFALAKSWVMTVTKQTESRMADS